MNGAWHDGVEIIMKKGDDDSDCSLMKFTDCLACACNDSLHFSHVLDSIDQLQFSISIFTSYSFRDTGKKLAIPKQRTNYLKDLALVAVSVVVWNMAGSSQVEASKCSEQIHCTCTLPVRANLELAALTFSIINIFHRKHCTHVM